VLGNYLEGMIGMVVCFMGDIEAGIEYRYQDAPARVARLVELVETELSDLTARSAMESRRLHRSGISPVAGRDRLAEIEGQMLMQVGYLDHTGEGTDQLDLLPGREDRYAIQPSAPNPDFRAGAGDIFQVGVDQGKIVFIEESGAGPPETPPLNRPLIEGGFQFRQHQEAILFSLDPLVPEGHPGIEERHTDIELLLHIL